MTRRQPPSRPAWVGVACVAFCLATAGRVWGQRLLAYASERSGNTDIRVMRASGVGDTPVTTHPSLDRHPTWSPDGRQIAFASDRDGVSQIYVIGRDGTELRRLTDDPQGAREPDWHPSEGRLLYSVWQAGGVADILTVDVDSGRVRNVSATALEWESAPAWSPNGKQIAAHWSEFPNAPAAVLGIAIMRDDGGHVAEFERRGMSLSGPSWSPDARRLALLRYPIAGDDGLAIYVLDMDGDELHRLTEALNDRWPSWSPDGKEIAFTTYRDGDGEIYSITTASKVLRRVTHRPGGDYEATWSPLGLAVQSPFSMSPTFWAWLKGPSTPFHR